MYQFSKNQLKRYSRQLIIPEIGLSGQEKLLKSKVLIIGAGGLGSVNLFYLTAAGVGNLGIVDDDKVQLDNLQRQILYTKEDIGRYKVESAKKRLNKLNGDVKIKIFKIKLNKSNAQNIFKQYDIIIDCTDNIPTRLIINKFAHKTKKSWIYGSVFLTEGQVSVIVPEKTLCYRCLFENEPDYEFIPESLKGGIIGVLPALIGSIQATEAIKLIIGRGSLLTNKLLIYEAMNMKFNIINVKKRKNCPVCGNLRHSLLVARRSRS